MELRFRGSQTRVFLGGRAEYTYFFILHGTYRWDGMGIIAGEDETDRPSFLGIYLQVLLVVATVGVGVGMGTRSTFGQKRMDGGWIDGSGQAAGRTDGRTRNKHECCTRAFHLELATNRVVVPMARASRGGMVWVGMVWDG